MMVVYIVCAIIAAAIVARGARRILRRRADERDPTRWLVIVEPSMFRVHETYVLGPFRRNEAEDVQRRETARHPFSQTWRREGLDCRIECAGRVLWPRQGD